MLLSSAVWLGLAVEERSIHKFCMLDSTAARFHGILLLYIIKAG
jgi:hypothetical protein